MDTYVLMALLATPGTWLVTALGAATVIFFKIPNVNTFPVTKMPTRKPSPASSCRVRAAGFAGSAPTAWRVARSVAAFGCAH